MNLSHFWYWLRTHTYNKYHLLDLRNYEYKWGWLEPGDKIFYAVFACLDEFINTGEPQMLIRYHKEALEKKEYNYGSEEIEKEKLSVYEEFITIHNWWHNIRPQLINEENIAIKKSYDSRHKKNRTLQNTNSDELFNLYKKLIDERNNLETMYVKRIIELRDYMWT
jgi:hypothetical protein